MKTDAARFQPRPAWHWGIITALSVAASGAVAQQTPSPPPISSIFGPAIKPSPAIAPVPPSPKPAAPPTEDSFKRKLEQTGLKYEIDKDGDYKILFTVGGTKRTQLVYVSGNTQTIDGLVIREFFAPAAKVSVSVNGAKALELLAESHRKKVGSWEIHGDGLTYTAKVSDSISAKDARSLLETIVNIADEAEVKLTGKDDY